MSNPIAWHARTTFRGNSKGSAIVLFDRHPLAVFDYDNLPQVAQGTIESFLDVFGSRLSLSE
jgi:hypothetical protein